MIAKKIKVIFDTNVWISFLIGKKLSSLKRLIVDGQIKIITTPQLLLEINLVTKREKLKKYFPPESVLELITLLNSIAENVEISPKNSQSRDSKDNFLLDLIEFSGADYLVTGDKDLLELNPFKSAEIINPSQFEEFLNNSFKNSTDI